MEDSEVLHLTSGPRSAVVESTTMAANTTANEPMDDGARKAAHDVLGVQIYLEPRSWLMVQCSWRGKRRSKID
jgi:hypothetical protein